MDKQALCIPREQAELTIDNWTPSLISRSICETDNTMLQVIPYVVLIDEDTEKVFMYQRGQAGGEDKLKSKWSIGLGGHIDEMPAEDESILDLIAREACRELKEEVGITLASDESEVYQSTFINGGKPATIYLPYSDNTADHVHLGVLIIQNVDKSSLGKHEEGVIEKGTWVSPSELINIATSKDETRVLEYWSQIATIEVVNEVISKDMSKKMNTTFIDSMKKSA